MKNFRIGNPSLSGTPTITKLVPAPKKDFDTITPVVNNTIDLHSKYAIEKAASKHVMSEFLEVLQNECPAKMDFIEFVDNHPVLHKLEQFGKEDYKKPANLDPTLLLELDGLFKGKVAAWPPSTDPQRNQKILQLMHGLANGVRYCAGVEERAKYEVTLGPTLLRRGAPFDTGELKKHFADKNNYMLGNVIWVMADDYTFYSHVCKIGRIHHSSFCGGNSIRAAGDWVVSNGKLISINGQSGHYKPGIEPFAAAVQVLHDKGVFANEKVIQVWLALNGQQTMLDYNTFMKERRRYYPYDPDRAGFFATA